MVFQNKRYTVTTLVHTMSTKKLWFKNKTYGWGWTPASWEGWVVVILFVSFVYFDFKRLDIVSHSASDTLRPYFIDLFFALVVLFWICYIKGEKPQWRWGK
jgi:hypothetical protein